MLGCQRKPTTMNEWKGKCLVRFSTPERAGAFSDEISCADNTNFDVQRADAHVFIAGPVLKLCELMKKRTDFVCYTLQVAPGSARSVENEWREIVEAAAKKALGQQ